MAGSLYNIGDPVVEMQPTAGREEEYDYIEGRDVSAQNQGLGILLTRDMSSVMEYMRPTPPLETHPSLPESKHGANTSTHHHRKTASQASRRQKDSEESLKDALKTVDEVREETSEQSVETRPKVKATKTVTVDLEAQKVATDFVKIKDHSRGKSRVIMEIKQELDATKRHNRGLEKDIQKLREELESMCSDRDVWEQSMKDTRNSFEDQLSIVRLEADLYKEDFLHEREDRENVHTLMEKVRVEGERALHAKEIEMDELRHACHETVQKLSRKLEVTDEDLENVQLRSDTSTMESTSGNHQLHEEVERTQRDLKAAQEEMQAKTDQVKQYKKRNDQQEDKESLKDALKTVDEVREETSEQSVETRPKVKATKTVTVDLEAQKVATDFVKIKDHSRGKSRVIMEIKQELDATKMSHDELLEYKVSLEHQVEDTERHSRRLENDNQKLREELESMCRDRDVWEQSMKDARNLFEDQLSIVRLEADLYKEDFLHEREDREKAHTLMENIRVEGERALHAKQLEMDELRHACNETVQKLSRKLEVTDEDLENVPLRSDTSTKESTSRNHQLHEEIERTQRDLKAFQEEMQARTAQVKQYKKRNDQQEDKIVKLEEMNEQLGQEMERVRQKLEETKKETFCFRVSRADLEAQVNEWKSHCDNLQSQLDAQLESDKLMAVGEVIDAQTVRDLQTDKNNMEDRIGQMNVRYSALQLELTDCRIQLETTIADTSRLSDEVLAKTQQVRQYKKQTDSYRATLDETADKLENIQRELQDRKDCIQRMEEDHQQHIEVVKAQLESDKLTAVSEMIDAQRAKSNLKRERQLQVMDRQMANVLKAETAIKEELEQKYSLLLDKSDSQFKAIQKLKQILAASEIRVPALDIEMISGNMMSGESSGSPILHSSQQPHPGESRRRVSSTDQSFVQPCQVRALDIEMISGDLKSGVSSGSPTRVNPCLPIDFGPRAESSDKQAGRKQMSTFTSQETQSKLAGQGGPPTTPVSSGKEGSEPESKMLVSKFETNKLGTGHAKKVSVLEENLDDEMRQINEDFTTNSAKQDTDEHFPPDLNFTCSHCSKVFRSNQLQKFKVHQKKCELAERLSGDTQPFSISSPPNPPSSVSSEATPRQRIPSPVPLPRRRTPSPTI